MHSCFRYTNITGIDEVRMRRSLHHVITKDSARRSFGDILSKIWKGFHFRLETPAFSWMKMVGGTKLGISMGVVVENFLEINIGMYFY